MAATGLVYGEGCWGWGEIVIVLEARTAAKGKVMTRLLSGVEWLGGRRRALVRYVRHKLQMRLHLLWTWLIGNVTYTQREIVYTQTSGYMQYVPWKVLRERRR